MEKTRILLDRIANGEAHARDLLVKAILPDLRRYAHNRLPPYARGVNTTEDLVLDAALKAVLALDRFEHRREGSFLAFARTIVRHEVIDKIRQAKARPRAGEIDTRIPAAGPSPEQEAERDEFMDKLEAALQELTPEQRAAFVLRFDFAFNYQRVAEEMGLPSPDAARAAVDRGIKRLASALSDFNPHG